jgi:hypothetical protein
MSGAPAVPTEAAPLLDSAAIFGSQSTAVASLLQSPQSMMCLPSARTRTSSSSQRIRKQTSHLISQLSTDSLAIPSTQKGEKSKGKVKAMGDASPSVLATSSVLPSPSKESQKAAIEHLDGNIIALDASLRSL